MENNIADSLLQICSILNKHSVRYIIVGGTAVALHGYLRPSTDVTGATIDKPDLDFWYNPTYENYFNLLNALEELGQDVTEFKKEQTPNPKTSFFRYELEQFTLDFLPELKAPLKFGLAFKKREVITLGKIAIPFISYDDLIADKETSARPKDIIDIKQLRNKRNMDSK